MSRVRDTIMEFLKENPTVNRITFPFYFFDLLLKETGTSHHELDTPITIALYRSPSNLGVYVTTAPHTSTCCFIDDSFNGNLSVVLHNLIDRALGVEEPEQLSFDFTARGQN